MPRKTWSPEQTRILIEMYPVHSNKEIGARIGKSHTAVKSRAGKLNLVKASGYDRNADRKISDKQIDFIQQNYLKYPNPELSKMIGVSESTLLKYRKELGIEGKENTGRIKKGNVPWSKGKKMPPGWGGKTRFKKGNIPHNTKEDGHVSVRYSKGRPYVWVRINIGYWRELHRIVWEQTHGKIPHGANVQFNDGNSLNCDPSNLYIITRDKQMLQNSIIRYEPELRSLIHLASKLKRKIKSHEERN